VAALDNIIKIIYKVNFLPSSLYPMEALKKVFEDRKAEACPFFAMISEFTHPVTTRALPLS